MKKTKFGDRLRTGGYNLCPCCYTYNCDPNCESKNSPFTRKKKYRLENNLCVSCGKNPCKCKNRIYKNNIK